jgi:hypothetical protein
MSETKRTVGHKKTRERDTKRVAANNLWREATVDGAKQLCLKESPLSKSNEEGDGLMGECKQ